MKRKNNQGFATVLLMTLLPAIIALGFSTFFYFSFLRSDLDLLNECRVEQLSTLNIIGRNLEKLLKMNPRALKLRAQEIRAQKALQVALQSTNPIAIMAAEARYLYVQTQRQILGEKQQSLIRKSDQLLAVSTSRMRARLAKSWRQSQNPLSKWYNTRFTELENKTPRMSVTPDMPDIAPAYGPSPGFEEEQSMAYVWQVDWRATGLTKSFLKFDQHFSRSCGASLYPEGSQWVAKMKKVKSSWKGFY